MKKLTVLLLILFGMNIKAQVNIASIFSDNMVLQRNVKIPIWGEATPSEEITVRFHNQIQKTLANKEGKWNVYLSNELAGGPYDLIVQGKNKIQISNILVGDVWLCSGQSNMEWSVAQSDNAKHEIESANYELIRHIKIPKKINSITNSNFEDAIWKICTPETVGEFTGIGYFFAKEIIKSTNVPIGIINASWGGTNIETWISREGFENNSEFKEMIAQMPKVNLDSLLNLKLEAEQIRIELLQKNELSKNSPSKFKELKYDDSSWLELIQPGVWEEQKLGNFDGIVWLRKHFKLKSKTSLVLEIPAIDDNDETYINGYKIGQTEGWDTKRSYQIPSEYLNVGNNVIAIRVTDDGGGGGIHGNESELKLINKNTNIQLGGKWKFNVESIKNNVNENEFPSLCYNAMIHPLIPFAFKGVLWYQGESNVPRAYQYNEAFPVLIEDWRTKWKSNFPFYYVQLASFKNKGNSNMGCAWAELREAQTNALKMENTGMVITTDLVSNPNDIHPTNKQDVGKRLASLALNNLYETKMICSGPTFKSFEVKEGNCIVNFENIGTGLSAKNNSNFIFGFEVAGDNQVFYPAKGKIVSEFINEEWVQNRISLTCGKVKKPVAIRYAWISDATSCNLFNEEGFPAIPFRTDNWKTVTLDEKYTIKK